MSDIQLYNGDCIEVMQNLIDKGVMVNAIITDPPYGITACDWDKIVPFDKFWEKVKGLRVPGANIVIFSKQPFTTMVNASDISEFKYEIIWKKQQSTNPMCAKKRVMPIHENISIFYDKPGTYNPQMRMGFSNYEGFKSSDDAKTVGEIYGNAKSVHRDCSDGSRYPISVIEFNNVRKAVHPTQKPIDMMEWLVKTYTNEGDLVLDPFMGSGTTGIACKNLNRNFIGIEKKMVNILKWRKRGLKNYETISRDI